MITIRDRVYHASAVLALHYETRSGDDERDQAGDIIADLLHLCDARGWDAEQLLATARMHHDAEMREAPSFSNWQIH